MKLYCYKNFHSIISKQFYIIYVTPECSYTLPERLFEPHASYRTQFLVQKVQVCNQKYTTLNPNKLISSITDTEIAFA